jgi:hypothetical protein
MGRAAQAEAAGGQAALAARGRPDPVTMARVRTALLGQLGGVMPAEPARVLGPSCHMDRRTVTPLGGTRPAVPARGPQ